VEERADREARLVHAHERRDALERDELERAVIRVGRALAQHGERVGREDARDTQATLVPHQAQRIRRRPLRPCGERGERGQRDARAPRQARAALGHVWEMAIGVAQDRALRAGRAQRGEQACKRPARARRDEARDLARTGGALVEPEVARCTAARDAQEVGGAQARSSQLTRARPSRS
jgi:hypothetical protein